MARLKPEGGRDNRLTGISRVLLGIGGVMVGLLENLVCSYARLTEQLITVVIHGGAALMFTRRISPCSPA